MHGTLLTAKEISGLKESDKMKIMNYYQNKVIKVKIKGLVVMYTGDDKYVAGLEILVPGVNEWRRELGLKKLSIPHITTSFLWRRQYPVFKAQVLKEQKEVEDRDGERNRCRCMDKTSNQSCGGRGEDREMRSWYPKVQF